MQKNSLLIEKTEESPTQLIKSESNPDYQNQNLIQTIKINNQKN